MSHSAATGHPAWFRSGQLLLLLVLAVTAACAPKLDQAVADLKSADAATREAAVERLGREGAPVAAKIAPLLASPKAEERGAAFLVMKKLGQAVLSTMLAQVDLAFASRETREGFADYFRGLGDTGYQRLLADLMATAERETKLNGPGGSIADLAAAHHHFESLSLVLEALTNNVELGRVPELLKHAYAPVRVRAAYLLCVKGWQAPSPELGAIYLTHLAETLECGNVPQPVEEAARLAATNFREFIEATKRFPAGGRVRDDVLVAAGTAEVARFIAEQARAARSDFAVAHYFELLTRMESDEGRRYARELLRDPQTGPIIRAVDPNAGRDL